MPTLFDFPATADIVSTTQEVVSGFFPQFLPVVYLAFGATIVVASIIYLRRIVKSIPKGVVGGGRRGRGRRR